MESYAVPLILILFLKKQQLCQIRRMQLQLLVIENILLS